MRDFRNAKAMAKTLREDLAGRSFQVSHSDSLELIAHVLGCKNWQTLAAAIEAPSPRLPEAKAEQALAGDSFRVRIPLPVIPMRDVVVLPEMTLPLFAGRAKTLRAIERAMAGDRRLFLVTQRREADEAPSESDLHPVGVMAVILQTMRLPDGTMKVMVQAERRARLDRLNDGELLEAEVEIVDTPPPDDASQTLAREALERFGRFHNLDPATPPIALARLPHMVGYPGVFADVITPLVATRLDQAQHLLETLDPAERLRKLLELMSEGRKAA